MSKEPISKKSKTILDFSRENFGTANPVVVRKHYITRSEFGDSVAAGMGKRQSAQTFGVDCGVYVANTCRRARRRIKPEEIVLQGGHTLRTARDLAAITDDLARPSASPGGSIDGRQTPPAFQVDFADSASSIDGPPRSPRPVEYDLYPDARAQERDRRTLAGAGERRGWFSLLVLAVMTVGLSAGCFAFMPFVPALTVVCPLVVAAAACKTNFFSWTGCVIGAVLSACYGAVAYALTAIQIRLVAFWIGPWLNFNWRQRFGGRFVRPVADAAFRFFDIIKKNPTIGSLSSKDTFMFVSRPTVGVHHPLHETNVRGVYAVGVDALRSGPTAFETDPRYTELSALRRVYTVQNGVQRVPVITDDGNLRDRCILVLASGVAHVRTDLALEEVLPFTFGMNINALIIHRSRARGGCTRVAFSSIPALRNAIHGDLSVYIAHTVNRLLPPRFQIKLDSRTRIFDVVIDVATKIMLSSDCDLEEQETVDYRANLVGFVADTTMLFAVDPDFRRDFVAGGSGLLATAGNSKSVNSRAIDQTIEQWNAMYPNSVSKIVTRGKTNGFQYCSQHPPRYSSFAAVLGVLMAVALRYLWVGRVWEGGSILIFEGVAKDPTEAPLRERVTAASNDFFTIVGAFAASGHENLGSVRAALRDVALSTQNSDPKHGLMSLKCSVLPVSYVSSVAQQQNLTAADLMKSATVSDVLKSDSRLNYNAVGEKCGAVRTQLTNVAITGLVDSQFYRETKRDAIIEALHLAAVVPSTVSETENLTPVDKRSVLSMISYVTRASIFPDFRPAVHAYLRGDETFEALSRSLNLGQTFSAIKSKLVARREAQQELVRAEKAIVVADKKEKKDVLSEESVADNGRSDAAFAAPPTVVIGQEKKQRLVSTAAAAAASAGPSGVLPKAALGGGGGGGTKKMFAGFSSDLIAERDVHQSEAYDEYESDSDDSQDDDGDFDPRVPTGAYHEAYVSASKGATSANIPMVFDLGVSVKGGSENRALATWVHMPSQRDGTKIGGILIPMDTILGTSPDHYAVYKSATHAAEVAFELILNQSAITITRDSRTLVVKADPNAPRYAFVDTMKTEKVVDGKKMKTVVYVGALFVPCTLSGHFGALPKFTINGRDLDAVVGSTSAIKAATAGITRDGKIMEAANIASTITDPIRGQLVFHQMNTNPGDCGMPFFTSTSVFGVHILAARYNNVVRNMFLSLTRAIDVSPAVPEVSLEALDSSWEANAFAAVTDPKIIEAMEKYQTAEPLFTLSFEEARAKVAACFRKYFEFTRRPDVPPKAVHAVGTNSNDRGVLLPTQSVYLHAETAFKSKDARKPSNPAAVEKACSVLAANFSTLRSLGRRIEDWEHDLDARYCVWLGVAVRLMRDASAGALFEVYGLTDASVLGDRTSRGFMRALCRDNAKTVQFVQDVDGVYQWLKAPGAPGSGILHMFGKYEQISWKKADQRRYREIKMPIFWLAIVQVALSCKVHQAGSVAVRPALFANNFTHPSSAFHRYWKALQKASVAGSPLPMQPWIAGWATLDDEMAANRGHTRGWLLGGDIASEIRKYPLLPSDVYTSCDISAWDGSLPDVLVEAFFSNLVENVVVGRNLFRVNCVDAFLMVGGDRYYPATYTGSCNWPSGNPHTLSGNSFMHAALLQSAGFRRFLVQGDDSAILASLEAVRTAYESWGFTLKEAAESRGCFDFCKLTVSAVENGVNAVHFKLSDSLQKAACRGTVQRDAVRNLVRSCDSVDAGCAEFLSLFPEGDDVAAEIRAKIKK